MDKRRGSKRVPISLEADLRSRGIVSKALIANISDNGLYVIATSQGKDRSVTSGDTVELKLKVASGQSIELQCKKVWSESDASASRIGLEIFDPPEQFRQFYKSTFYRIRNESSHEPIAVVGMACYYPGAPNLTMLWENILARRREFRRIPEQRLSLSDYYDPDPFAQDKTYANRAAVIDGFEFDWVKRGIPKSVVESSDIVHWLALEVALQALEDAGYTRETIPSDRSGAIIGNTLTGEHSRAQSMRLRWPYVKKALRAAGAKKHLPPAVLKELMETMEVIYKSAFAPVTEDTLAGNLSNTIAGRICNFLDLRGGAYTVDGACSSSLIAVATAASHLTNGAMDIALVGGVDISLDTFELIGFAKTNALTRDDMRVYDRRASGFIPGEGCGFVVLKRLEAARAHGNRIYGVLRGWGISSDGKGGITAPKAKTQALAIQRAYGASGYGLRDVDFIEGHGTGTIAGDKAELEGIALAMGNGNGEDQRTCGITSLKSIIGHTKAASGIGGFIKAIMAVNKRVIPPTASCKEPNSTFNETAREVYPVIQGELRNPDETLRAGVSGMGFGGINCHVTVESPEEPARRSKTDIGERELLVSSQDTEVFPLSAVSQQEMVDRLHDLKGLSDDMSVGEMVDLSSRLAGELSPPLPFRLALIAASPDGLGDCIDRALKLIGSSEIPAGVTISNHQNDIWVGSGTPRCRVGFLFPGQGSQQLNMARVLIERYPWARDFMAQGEAWLKEAGYGKVSEFMYRPVDRTLGIQQLDEWRRELSRTEVAQPSLCLASLLWMRHLEHLGIRPVVAGGHSLGELIAFHAAGVFDERSLLLFAALRGRLMAANGNGAGIMASFACGREKAEELLAAAGGYAVVANINGPEQTVVSGEERAVQRAMRLGEQQGVRVKQLAVSNAFHSRFMTEAAESLYRDAPIPEAMGMTAIKLLTTDAGCELGPGLDLRTHFAAHLVGKVDLIALVTKMRRECDLMVEVGPGRVLSDLTRYIAATEDTLCFPVEARPGDDRSLNVLLGAYFAHGGEVAWQALFENRLVRPFVPASKRRFIENPCERPIAPDGEAEASLDDYGEESPATPAGAGFSAQELDVIRRLVHREIRAVASEAAEYLPHPAGESQQSPALLIRLASEITGFPEQAISLHHRLLDNLNLDSIKAGLFASKAMKAYGVEGRVDPTTMANSSLQEIYDAISPFLAAGHRPEASPPGAGHAEVAVGGPRERWVRDFTVTYIEKQRPSSHSLEDLIARLLGESRQILFVSEKETDARSAQMRVFLAEKGIASGSASFNQLLTTPVTEYGQYDYFVFLLPAGGGSGPLTEDGLRAMTARMHCIGTVVNALKANALKPAYAVVQWGSGMFHTYDAEGSIESKGASAFLCSLHLDNPAEKLHVLEFAKSDNHLRILTEIVAELRSDEQFTAAAFDDHFTRRVPALEPLRAEAFKDRGFRWGADDVVLVTGGARGITAECALAFGLKTGAKMALVGTTDLSTAGEETTEALERFRNGGVPFRYYACDVTNKDEVFLLMAKIREELGTVTGVIHGAALNKPRRIELVVLRDAFSEISPKVLGAMNILEALRGGPLKLFAGFSSIIGVTGMMGNAWYGFSNEVLNLLLQQAAEDKRSAQVISCAFSVWDEVGMGKRMGSLEVLEGLGIDAIPKAKGVEHFMRLVEKDAGDRQVIVAGRMGGIGTLYRHPLQIPRGARFLEETLVYERDVEIEAKASLSFDSDPYLKEHVYNGTHLFPTVMGLEAMAQAALAVAGTPSPDCLRIEDVLLSYPITVEPGGSTGLQIHAMVDDPASGEEGLRIKASIRVEQTGYLRNHFEATFVLGRHCKPELYAGHIESTLLDIVPHEDLYGHMLWQGPSFQRITTVRSMSDNRVVFESNREHLPEFALGNPFFRDTLLQSEQVILPDLVALPVEIKRWDIFPGQIGEGPHTVIAEITDRTSEMITGNVTVTDNAGRIVERLSGYKAKIMETVHGAPLVADLASPDEWDLVHLNDALESRCEELGYMPPAISLRHLSGIHKIERNERRKVEKALLAQAYERLVKTDGDLPAKIAVAWTEEGRPYVRGADNIGISCSHDDRMLLCAAGRGALGCDIEMITQRGEEEWRGLLGTPRLPLLEKTVTADKCLDTAGTRIWTAIEALRKASSLREGDLHFEKQTGDAIVFRGADFEVVTFPVKLLRGRPRMVAVALARGSRTAGHRSEAEAEDRIDSEWGMFVPGGPQGQKVFVFRFPLVLRDSATIGGGVYFASYFNWLGKVREMALKPIGKYIAEEFFKGHFMVTNSSASEIWARVRNHEDMAVRTWIERVFGANDSALLLHFEWSKLMPDGRTRVVAFSKHQVSWVRTTGHGIVEPVACPDFFMEFMRKNDFLPKTDASGTPSGGPAIKVPFLGNVLFEGNPFGDKGSHFEESIFDTTMEHSNLAQNIYFSNYFTWQGQVRDRYLYSLAPDSYRTMGEHGQFVCVRSEVTHLREAMPFDRIAVTMRLRTLYQCGLDLYFEYFRADAEGKRTKLAYGGHTVAWVRVDDDDNYVPQELPESYRQVILLRT